MSLLQPLSPDIAVLQECARPTSTSSTCLWFGDYENQGICVLAGTGYTLEAVLPIPDLPRYVVPVRVRGPESFLLFAVWTHREPTYVEPVLRAAEAYAELIRSEPTVIMGDFNSNAIWDKRRKPARDHAALVNALAELGLVSSYHHFFGEAHGKETRPTHYFRWHEHEPFHLDYCFIPQGWTERLVNVEVGSYERWKQWSDHRPLTVDISPRHAPGGNPEHPEFTSPSASPPV